MKTISDDQRRAIDNLRKTQDQNAEPTWEVNIFRDQERMLGIMSGERITSGPPRDVNPSIAQSSDGRYHVVLERNGMIFYMVSSETNVPAVEWQAEQQLFAGSQPDLEFDGTFSTTGLFSTTDAILAYENPPGTMLFRRKTGGSWSSPVLIGAGFDPSIVRGWADPPGVGTADMGLILAYTNGGELFYRYSEDQGASWSAPISIDFPPGGSKSFVQVARLADYTHGFIYDYFNGITSEVWFLKSTRKYVHIASPDEILITRAGQFAHHYFQRLNMDGGEETVIGGAGNFTIDTFPFFSPRVVEETVQPGAGGFEQVFYSGVNP